MFIRGKSLGAVWVAYLTHIINTGTFVSDDKEPIIETPPICLEITNISYDDPIIKAFGSERVIEMYVRKMFSKEIIQELNSTYGDRIFDNQGVDQFEWMVARLKKKWWAKSAVIGLIKPNDPGPRIPCLISLQTTIRKNHITVNGIFRSQNAFRSYGNAFGIFEIQRRLAQRLGAQLGSVRMFVTCPHIYESDISAAQEIIRVSRQFEIPVISDAEMVG